MSEKERFCTDGVEADFNLVVFGDLIAIDPCHSTLAEYTVTDAVAALPVRWNRGFVAGYR